MGWSQGVLKGFYYAGGSKDVTSNLVFPEISEISPLGLNVLIAERGFSDHRLLSGSSHIQFRRVVCVAFIAIQRGYVGRAA
jgi:hypothetical protein